MASKKRPNIIFILADDMGYGNFSCFNYGASKTANLDALMRESVCLTQHYSALCTPARAALMTGRYPHRTGVIDTIASGEMDCLATRETTMADVFTEETVGFIKRHSNASAGSRQVQPFFLHLAYNAPYGPFQAPEEKVAPFLEDGRFNNGNLIKILK